MGRQKFVQYIRMLYLGFIDLNRTVKGNIVQDTEITCIRLTAKILRLNQTDVSKFKLEFISQRAIRSKNAFKIQFDVLLSELITSSYHFTTIQ